MTEQPQVNPYQAPQSTDLPRTEGMPELAHLGTAGITFFFTFFLIGVAHAVRSIHSFNDILKGDVLLKYVVTVIGATFGFALGIVAFLIVMILICMFIEKVLKIKL